MIDPEHLSRRQDTDLVMASEARPSMDHFVPRDDGSKVNGDDGLNVNGDTGQPSLRAKRGNP
jgi:hypothetical protein